MALLRAALYFNFHWTAEKCMNTSISLSLAMRRLFAFAQKNNNARIGARDKVKAVHMKSRSKRKL
jgi:hypothetical protein